MNPVVTSFLLACGALILVIAATYLYRISKRAKDHNDETGREFNDPKWIAITKIGSILLLIAAIVCLCFCANSRTKTFKDDNGFFLPTDKKDSLVFGGNVYVLKEADNQESEE